jgi:hypothetical protein
MYVFVGYADHCAVVAAILGALPPLCGPIAIDLD